MNPEEPKEKALREAMGTLRRSDEQKAPPFEAMWGRGMRSQPRARPARRLAVAAAMIAPLAAAAGLALTMSVSRDSAPPASSSAAALAANASSPSTRRLPASAPAAAFPSRGLGLGLDLDFLLREPHFESMARLPDFDIDPVSHRPLP